MIFQLYTQADAHKARARLYYQAELPWCFHWIWLAEGFRVPIYSNGAQLPRPFTSLMARRPYQDTVHTWSAMSLSATRSSGTSTTGLMTPFQTLSFSGGGGISKQGTGSAPAQCAHGSLGDNKLSCPVFLCVDSRCFVGFPREEHLFPKQKVVGRRFLFRASTRPSRSPYCLGATLRVRLCDTLFSFMSPRPSGSTLPSCLRSISLWSVFQPSLKVLASPNSGQVGVLQAATTPCLHFKPLDLLSNDLMFAFVRTEEVFFLF
jgi:hypothetical protein